MLRRDLLRGLLGVGLCPLCAASSRADTTPHWTYEGEDGPAHWARLSPANLSCGLGSQQSPIDIVDPVKADLPPIVVGWGTSDGTIVNNGHTIQIDVPKGGGLSVGSVDYDLVQFHFHARSEHLVGGSSFPMEAHFVHKRRIGDGLGVIGVFLVPGKANATFTQLAAAFPQRAGQRSPLAAITPATLLPTEKPYWCYEGSLTTPPCSESVDWMVMKTPIQVRAEDIAQFTSLFQHNARPVAKLNRRYVLESR